MTEEEWKKLFKYIRNQVKAFGLSSLEKHIPEEIFDDKSDLSIKDRVLKYLEAIEISLKPLTKKAHSHVLEALNGVLKTEDGKNIEGIEIELDEKDMNRYGTFYRLIDLSNFEYKHISMAIDSIDELYKKLTNTQVIKSGPKRNQGPGFKPGR